MRSLSMLVITAHPDDETLGFGGTIARYAADGVAVSLITATRGDRGRWHGLPLGQQGHPGAEAVATAREAELRRAAAVVGVQHLEVMDYGDGQLDRSDWHDIVGRLATQIRAMRPDVIVTFGPDGAYGHPDHIAVSQFVCAAVVAAARTTPGYAEAPHTVSKLYFLAWPEAAWAAYQAAFKTLTSRVDGVERHVVPWPDWAITTTIETRDVVSQVFEAVQCHASQTSSYHRLLRLSSAEREQLFGRQSFYRAMSLANGGRVPEHDLFEGIGT